MPPSARGSLSFKPLLLMAILAGLVAVGARTFSVYSTTGELDDYVRDRALHASLDRLPSEQVQNEIVGYAHRLGLPVSREAVSVVRDGDTVTVAVDYTVPVDLRLIRWRLRFTPSVVSRAYN